VVVMVVVALLVVSIEQRLNIDMPWCNVPVFQFCVLPYMCLILCATVYVSHFVCYSICVSFCVLPYMCLSLCVTV
jgi:hypothetical protein